METWIANHFFNPAFVAGGAALVASPIIIHLINRMRYRRVQFAAMEFLLQSEQRNRRRLLIEQLLLLLLRILIVLALVALIARLILDPNQLTLFRGAKAHHVVLLDDSASMRDRWGETSAFAEALSVVKKIVAEGARRPDTQKFSLILLSDPEQSFLPERDVNDAFLSELETKLENLACSHQSFDLIRGLEAARIFLKDEKGTIQQLHVVSDFRQRDWEDQKALSAAIEALTTAGVTVNLVRTVPEQHANLGVIELGGAVQLAAANVPLRLTVGVQNFGDQPASDVRLSILDDGNKIPISVSFDKIEAGEAVYRDVDVRLTTAARHRLEVGLEADALGGDNRRYLAVDVSNRIPVLIVDGDPAGEAGRYVADALAADPASTGIDAVVESPEALRRRPLAEYSCLYLLNATELPADALDALETYVESGGGLAWFVGDAIRPSFYSEELYDDGQGIFPAPLASAPRGLAADVTNPGPDLKVSDHPLFLILQGEDNPFIDGVRIERYFPPAELWPRDDQQRADRTRTIARLRNGEPIVLEQNYGSGRVVTCLTTADPAWNDWAVNPSYVVFQLDLLKYLARRDRSLEVRTVGEPILLSLDPAEYTETVEIVSPEAEGERITRLQAAPEESTTDKLRLEESFRDTDQPGVYAIRLVRQSQIPEERLIAYNVPLAESDLSLASSDEIRKRLDANPAVRIQEPGQFEWIQGEEAGAEIRTALLVLLFMALAAEQLMAYRLSFHPQPAGAAA